MSPRGRHLVSSSSSAAHNAERAGHVSAPRNCSPPRPFTSMDNRSSRDQSTSEPVQRPASGTRIYIKREILNQVPFESDMNQRSNDAQPETERPELSVEPLSEEFLRSKSFQRRLEIQNQFKAESDQSVRDSVQARRLRNNPPPDKEATYPNQQAIRMDSASEPTTMQDIKESFYSRFTKLSSNNSSAVSGSLTARTDPGPSSEKLPHLARDRSNEDRRPGSRSDSRGGSRRSKRIISESEGPSSPNPTFLTKAQQAEVARILQENSLISTHKLLPSAHIAQLQKQQIHLRTADPVQRALETRIGRTEEIHRVHNGNHNGNCRNGRRDERDVLGNCFGHRASPEMERLIIYHIQTYFPSWITAENRCQIHRKWSPSVFHVITLGKSAPTSVCCQCPVLLQLDLQTEGRVLCMSERCRNPTVAQYPLPRDLKIALWGLWAVKDHKQVESSVIEVAEPVYSNSTSAAALAVGAHRSVETQLSDDRDDSADDRIRCKSVASYVKNREFRSESSQCGTEMTAADDRMEKVERAPFGSSLRAISSVNQYQNLELDPDSTLDLTALKSNNNFDARIASKEEIDKRNRLEKRPNHEIRSYSPDRDRDQSRSPTDDPGPSYWSKLEPPPVHLSMAELRRMEENGQMNHRVQPVEIKPRADSRADLRPDSRADSRIGSRRPVSQAAQIREVGSGRSSVLGHHEAPVRVGSALDSRAASSLSFNAPDGQVSLPSIQHELGALVNNLRQRRAEQQARSDSTLEPDIPEDDGDEDSRSGSPIPRPVSRIGHGISKHHPSIPANRIGEILTNQTISHRTTTQPSDSDMNQLEPTAVHTPLAYRHTRVAPPQNLTENNVAASDRNSIIERVVASDKLIQQMVPFLPADVGMEQLTQQLDVSTLSSLIQKARVEG
eukprot:GILK01009720.1.p1 GENE.GILK01009720.1~~GILK01009720.1.p1  ORF type:complete len:1012 (-),score=201.19 GILK01009720.1:147-2846(-)